MTDPVSYVQLGVRISRDTIPFYCHNGRSFALIPRKTVVFAYLQIRLFPIAESPCNLYYRIEIYEKKVVQTLDVVLIHLRKEGSR